MAEIEFSVNGHRADVRINRPEVRNALNVVADQALREAWLEVNRNPDIWVAVISAEGETFCAGADIRDFDAREATRIAVGGGLTGLGGVRLMLEKPLIAAVQGYALGSGFELAMCADIIVASETAKFGLPESKLGVLGEAGVLHRVTRQLPYRVAMGIVLTGKPIGAHDALLHGLVNEVVPDGELGVATDRWADAILECSPLAAQAAKQVIEGRLGWPLDVALSTRYEPIEALRGSEDYREAVTAFGERRPPVWRGR